MVAGLHFILGLGETHVFGKGQRLSFHIPFGGTGAWMCLLFMDTCQNASLRMPPVHSHGSRAQRTVVRHCFGPLPAFSLQQPREAPQQNTCKMRASSQTRWTGRAARPTCQPCAYPRATREALLHKMTALTPFFNKLVTLPALCPRATILYRHCFGPSPLPNAEKVRPCSHTRHTGRAAGPTCQPCATYRHCFASLVPPQRRPFCTGTALGPSLSPRQRRETTQRNTGMMRPCSHTSKQEEQQDHIPHALGPFLVPAAASRSTPTKPREDATMYPQKVHEAKMRPSICAQRQRS